MKSRLIETIPEVKKKEVKILEDLIKKNKTILVASIKNLPGSQFQEISKKLRGKAIVKVPKKNLIFRAIDNLKNKELKKIENQITESVAILFSNLDSYDLAWELLKNKSPSKAKPGQEAPFDIQIDAGPTELVPGPAISELGSVGLQVQIENGKITIRESRVIVKQGDKISQKAVDVMTKLNIKPFSIGFIPLSSYDTKLNMLYLDIKIDKEKAVGELRSSFRKSLAFATEIGYICSETLRVRINKASAQERRLIRVISGEPEEVTPIKEVKDSSKKLKEESKANATEGLASLFG